MEEVIDGPFAPPHTPTSSQSLPTPRESLSSSVFESNENINFMSTVPTEHHRNNAGFLNSVGTKHTTDESSTEKDQRDSGVGLETTSTNVNDGKKTLFFREPLVSEV